jgi:hypothetical protein
MASVTLSLPEKLKSELEHFDWVNWSSVARLELRKKRIFEEYIKTGELSDKDWKFCEETDWHPVDELPLKGGFLKELEKAKREKPIKLKSAEDIFQ